MGTCRFLASSLTLASAAAAIVAMPPPAASAGSGESEATCRPIRGILVARTVRRRLEDRNEVMEPLGKGAYRITRCDFDGRLTSSMTVARVPDADGRRVLAPITIMDRRKAVSIRYGDPSDPRWARLWRRVRLAVAATVLRRTRGRLRRDPAFRPRASAFGQLAPPGPVARVAAGPACDDATHIVNGPKWTDKGYAWRWRSSSFGDSYETRDALKSAHAAWDTTFTDCDYDDVTQLRAEYKGSTGKPAGAFDDVNTADKGDVGELCPGAVACNVAWRADDDELVESDTRFNKSMRWSNSGKDGAYDYRSVATHEFGHMIGLADLPDSPGLTMHFQASTTSTKARTLGRGDIRGLRGLYP
jgi:Matrixin